MGSRVVVLILLIVILFVPVLGCATSSGGGDVFRLQLRIDTVLIMDKIQDIL